MSSRRNVFLSGLTAVLLAAVIIGASGLAGVLPTSTTPQSGGNNNGNNGNNGGNNNGTIDQGGNNGGVSQPESMGTLAIVATDPPNLAAGITGVQVSYDSLAVHSAQVASSGGWLDLNVTGSFDSLALVNVGQTLISAQVPAGTYDFVRIHITSVAVTYNGSVYQAALANDQLTVAMEGGVMVNGTKAGIALLDIQPTVLNAGSNSTPQFVFSTVLKVYLVDPVNFTSSALVTGSRTNLTVAPWVPPAVNASAPSLAVTKGTLTAGSLALTVKNTGNSNVNIRLIILKQIGPTVGSPANTPDYRLPSFADSIVFSVQPDGSLKVISLAQPILAGSGNVTPIFQSAGFTLLTGSSVTFSYTGALTMGNQTLVPTNYQITVVGDTAETTFNLPLS